MALPKHLLATSTLCVKQAGLLATCRTNASAAASFASCAARAQARHEGTGGGVTTTKLATSTSGWAVDRRCGAPTFSQQQSASIASSAPVSNFQIDVRDGNVEEAIRQWKRKFLSSGLQKSNRDRQKFVRPCKKRFNDEKTKTHRQMTRKFGRMMGWINYKKENCF
ncbi:hypothetical protein PPROV_000745700 [Pycnococcus provasolii]|uniref:Ribosomal protein S21 n=1 Tax=Pycnococcus provasolii TaxID=41880 RepID=A0A830HSJ3_9CHLO|nr:hypothetical protein PPROV_000745700 [Pycnococcus provasolii]